MSITITGLEMPTERESFNLTIKYNGTVLDTETGMQVAEAHGLPPHGRLIDADALFDFILSIYKTAQGDARKAYRDVLDTIVAAGDVIPAEEGET